MKTHTKEFWEKAYQNNIGKLIGACYRYTRNYQLSEDLAHDAFLKAIDKSGTFEGKGKFEAWLRRITLNHTLQYLRDSKKLPLSDDLSPYVDPQDLEEEKNDAIESMSFTSDELFDIIGRLPEHHRLVFHLHVLDEFTHAQIASTLGISEGTSKSHLARARKKLQQLLREKAAEDRRTKEESKGLVLLFTGDVGKNMDQLFRNCAEEFSIPPQKPLSLQQASPVHPGKFGFKIPVAAALLTVTVSVVWIVSQPKMRDQIQPLTSTIISDSNKKNTATISKNSVIVKRKLKQQKMKPLDSLALMLALSTGAIQTVAAKDSIRNEIEKSPLVVDSTTISIVDKKESGSFRASQLYWSEKNEELYFKGQVRVNFKEQNFKGNGSFTFLGKVYLLFVDGQEITIGKTIRLNSEDYELTTLDGKEAKEKYGDKGLNGAVEVTRTQK